MHLQALAKQTKDSTILAAARQTLIQKGDESTGWSTGWRINLWARLGDGNHAYKIYQNLLSYVSPEGYRGKDAVHHGGTYPNLFDAHPPFQIDGNFGGTAGVCEMLVQSSVDMTTKKPIYNIHLLPALPNAWANGEIKGIRTRGGLTIDMKWENKLVTSLQIKAATDVDVNITYNNKSSRMKLRQGGIIKFSSCK